LPQRPDIIRKPNLIGRSERTRADAMLEVIRTCVISVQHLSKRFGLHRRR
jgi:hypothetical protein